VGREAAPAWSSGAAALSAAIVLLLVSGLLGPGGRPAAAPPDAYFRLSATAYGAGQQNTRMGEPTPEELARREAGRPYRLRPITGFTADVGWELYTRYTVPFEVASLILTVSVVGAVAVGRQGAKGEVKGEI